MPCPSVSNQRCLSGSRRCPTNGEGDNFDVHYNLGKGGKPSPLAHVGTCLACTPSSPLLFFISSFFSYLHPHSFISFLFEIVTLHARSRTTLVVPPLLLVRSTTSSNRISSPIELKKKKKKKNRTADTLVRSATTFNPISSEIKENNSVDMLDNSTTFFNRIFSPRLGS